MASHQNKFNVGRLADKGLCDDVEQTAFSVLYSNVYETQFISLEVTFQCGLHGLVGHSLGVFAWSPSPNQIHGHVFFVYQKQTKPKECLPPKALISLHVYFFVPLAI